MASPNFPRNYLNDLHESKTIEVAKGNVFNIHFTDFQLESEAVDYVEITDGDGTLLGRFRGEYNIGGCTLFQFKKNLYSFITFLPTSSTFRRHTV